MLDRGPSALPQVRASGKPPSLPPIILDSIAYALTLQASHMSERMVSPMARVQSPEDIGAHGASCLSPSHALSLALAIFESVSVRSSQWDTFWGLVSISLAMSRWLTFRSVMASRTRSSSSLSFILILRFLLVAQASGTQVVVRCNIAHGKIFSKIQTTHYT